MWSTSPAGALLASPLVAVEDVRVFRHRLVDPLRGLQYPHEEESSTPCNACAPPASPTSRSGTTSVSCAPCSSSPQASGAVGAKRKPVTDVELPKAPTHADILPAEVWALVDAAQPGVYQQLDCAMYLTPR
jgi:hypothetical protein